MADTPNQTARRLLLLEDNPAKAKLIHDLLATVKGIRFTVVAVADPRVGVQTLAREAFDVVLLDLDLPDGAGRDALSVLRRSFSEVPVVLFGADQDPGLPTKAHQDGFLEYLPEDELRPRELARTLRFAMERMAHVHRSRTLENQYRQFLEQTPNLVFRTDPWLRLTYLNPAVETITGYQPQELLGMDFLHLVTPDRQAAARDHYDDQLRSGTDPTYRELLIVTKSGRERWLGQRVWLSQLENGEACLEGIAWDITDRKMAEGAPDARGPRNREGGVRQLDEDQITWERIFDAVPDLILITDPDLKITMVNLALAKHLRRSPQELEGMTCGDTLLQLIGEEPDCPLPPGFTPFHQFPREVHAERLGGDFLVSTSVIPDNQGGVAGHIHVARDITRQKQIEKMVKDQLRFLHELLDTIPNPIFFKDSRGVYTGCNRAYEDLLGLPAEDIVGKKAEDLFSPEQAAVYLEKDRVLRETGGVQVYESQLCLPGSPPRDVLYSKSVLRDTDGQFSGLVGVVQDISERRAAELALRASEIKYRSLFEQAPISLWEEDFSELKRHLDQLRTQGVTDLEEFFQRNPQELAKCAQLAQIVDVNAYTLHLYEANDRQELFTRLDQVFTEGSQHAFRKEIVAFYNGITNVSVTSFNRTLRGKQLYVLVNVSLAPGAEQNWDRVLVSIQDLTEHREAETALRQSERRYRGLVEALTEGLLQVDDQVRIQFCNPRFSEMTGYTMDELIGKPVHALMDAANRQKLVTQFATRRSGGHDTYELTFQSKSGQALETVVSPRAIFDDKGVFVGAYSLITDVTKLKKLELQLRQSQKLEAIGQLAAGIAHEINTPTQYVSSNSKFLLDGFADLLSLQRATAEFLRELEREPAWAERLGALREQAEEIDLEFLLEEIPKALAANLEGLERIAIIVRSMKDFAHPGREEKQPTDLNQIIENTVTVARNEWKYVAEVETDLAPDLPPVNCVSNEIKQVVLNIVVNAAQAIGEVVTEEANPKGRIRIKSRADRDQAIITISDTGPGIPPELRQKIFDPFFTTKEPGKGTGQGLAIAYRAVVETHHGSLNLRSVPGQGATFEIRLPLKDPTAAEQNA